MRLKHYLLTALFAILSTQVLAAPDQPESLDDLVSTIHTEDTGKKKKAAANAAAGDLLMQAMSLLGVAYRFGGSTPSAGLDCSGFIQYIFQKSLKINLPRTAAQMAKTGQSVEKHELQPGDLVFFNTRGFANSHVGLYMGNNKFIHSPRTGKSVEFAHMSSAYWTKRYNGARRINRSNTDSLVTANITPKRVRTTIPAQVSENAEKQTTTNKQNTEKNRQTQKKSTVKNNKDKKAGKTAKKSLAKQDKNRQSKTNSAKKSKNKQNDTVKKETRNRTNKAVQTNKGNKTQKKPVSSKKENKKTNTVEKKSGKKKS